MSAAAVRIAIVRLKVVHLLSFIVSARAGSTALVNFFRVSRMCLAVGAEGLIYNAAVGGYVGPLTRRISTTEPGSQEVGSLLFVAESDVPNALTRLIITCGRVRGVLAELGSLQTRSGPGGDRSPGVSVLYWLTRGALFKFRGVFGRLYPVPHSQARPQRCSLRTST